jgi:hypothetical protein
MDLCAARATTRLGSGADDHFHLFVNTINRTSGLREDHPGIVFRNGPAGRRPGLAAGPDVWEVIGALNGAPNRGEPAILYTADYLGLTSTQVRAAVGYYAAYKAEIDVWIARNDEEADAAEALWRDEQAGLA